MRNNSKGRDNSEQSSHSHSHSSVSSVNSACMCGKFYVETQFNSGANSACMCSKFCVEVGSRNALFSALARASRSGSS